LLEEGRVSPAKEKKGTLIKKKEKGPERRKNWKERSENCTEVPNKYRRV